MHPIRLTQDVIVEGLNLWGLKSKIIFSPLDIRDGWMWQSDKPFFIKINPSIIDKKARRTRLYFQGKKLQVFEHIGALRWFGLCDISIASNSWPPYYGRSLELWQAIKPFCKEDTSKDINWYTIKRSVSWSYPKVRNGQKAYTIIRPNFRKELKVKIVVSYPGLEIYEINFTLPNKESLEKICRVYSQGWPPILYHLLKVPSFFGWPHHRKTIWPQRYSKRNTSIAFAYHRALDLLGTLSLICPDGLLSATVISVCSGHEADIRTIIQADKLLYLLG